MEQKYQILKTVDIDENLVVIIAKRVETKPKKCGQCRHIEKCGNTIYFCNKHRGLVFPEDTCIEEGM